MKKILIDEMKKIQIEILLQVHEICEDSNLRYYLTYGTLLGAIRHNGFIPWDDDIDIAMPRKDYSRFIDIFSKLNHENLTITSIECNKKHLYTYAKIYNKNTIKIENGVKNNIGFGGVDIDIFPIDGLPENEKKSMRYFKHQKLLFRMYSLSMYDFSKSKFFHHRILYNLVALIAKIIGTRMWIVIINKNGIKYDSEKSTYIASSMASFYGNKEKILNKQYVERFLVEFEGLRFWAPKNYHIFLSNLYGDYMILPPLDKRVTHHNYEVFWK